jgi:hypothetical protein
MSSRLTTAVIRVEDLGEISVGLTAVALQCLS